MSGPRYGSLRLRFIVAMVAMLLLVVAAFGIIAHQVVRRSAKEAAVARLQSVARQFVTMATPGFLDARSRLTAAATDPLLQTALRTGERSEGLEGTLRALAPANNPLNTVSLGSPAGDIVAAAGDLAPMPPYRRADTATVGPLFVAHDTVFLEVSVPVRTGDTTVGHLVQTTRLVAAATAIAQLTNMIGPEAVLLLGNQDGSVWTDLRRVVQRPPPASEGREYDREGRLRVAGSQPFAGLPLAVAIEMPADQALTPARSLAQGFLGIGLLVTGLGATLAWWVARTITEPLGSLTRAAQAIAGGGSLTPPPMPVARRDEIGTLARAFTAMTDQVRTGVETLESQVSTRTAQLSDALAQLEAAQKDLVRKERLATLGQLSSSVGHELRNPLGVMTNAVYYLEATQRDATPKVREYLGIIRNQIRISEKIVADLLDYARVNPPQRSAVPVDAFIDDALTRVSIPASVTVVKGIDGAATMLVDSVQIGQVVINLFSNAVQAMEPNGGTLTIRARVDGGCVVIEVADTGPGISDENREHIFEPLFTTKARGIGLGLAVSRGLARANGGDLAFETALGRGTTFTLTVPSAG